MSSVVRKNRVRLVWDVQVLSSSSWWWERVRRGGCGYHGLECVVEIYDYVGAWGVV